jgi:hypothetical protein
VADRGHSLHRPDLNLRGDRAERRDGRDQGRGARTCPVRPTHRASPRAQRVSALEGQGGGVEEGGPLPEGAIPGSFFAVHARRHAVVPRGPAGGKSPGPAAVLKCRSAQVSGGTAVAAGRTVVCRWTLAVLSSHAYGAPARCRRIHTGARRYRGPNLVSTLAPRRIRRSWESTAARSSWTSSPPRKLMTTGKAALTATPTRSTSARPQRPVHMRRARVSTTMMDRRPSHVPSISQRARGRRLPLP